MKLLNKRESGQALIMILIILALGSLSTIPVLNLASTSLNYHRVIEGNTLESYAADSGIEYALYKLGNNLEPFGPEPLPTEVNERTVNVTAEYLGGNIYKITSIATNDSDSSTSIESYVEVFTYPYFFDNAITAVGDIEIQPGTEIYGDVQYNGTLDNKGTVYGETTTEPITSWPTAEELSQFYWIEAPIIEESSIDISSGTEQSPYPIGPARTSGNLTLTGSGIAELNGTLYVQGNLTVMPGVTIKLNEETIYAEGDINIQPGAYLSGPGCVIAAGDVQFQPNLLTDDFIFVMSVNGDVQFQPGTDFYGSIAGNVTVTLQPGCTLNTVAPESDPNFPDDSDTDSVALQTISYTIKG